MSTLDTSEYPTCCGQRPAGWVEPCGFDKCKRDLFNIKCVHPACNHKATAHDIFTALDFWKKGRKA